MIRAVAIPAVVAVSLACAPLAQVGTGADTSNLDQIVAGVYNQVQRGCTPQPHRTSNASNGTPDIRTAAEVQAASSTPTRALVVRSRCIGTSALIRRPGSVRCPRSHRATGTSTWSSAEHRARYTYLSKRRSKTSIFNAMHPFQIVESHRLGCPKRWTEVDFTWTNCGRGLIKAADNRGRGFGCSRCNTAWRGLKCSCGTELDGSARAGMARHLFPCPSASTSVLLLADDSLDEHQPEPHIGH